MRRQGELQRHQAAAHRPVAGADEEAEEHAGGRLLHVLHEAPAQVALVALADGRRESMEL